jgi:MIP family channel proteins
LSARSLFAEALGTSILVLIGCGASIVSATTHAFGHSAVALSFGLVITLLVASLGGMSGAHFNPAVTLAFWSVQQFPTRQVLPYIVAQCVGAVAASFVLLWLFGGGGGFGATVPTLATGRAFVIEGGFSGILALAIFSTANRERIPVALAPFVIGATVFAGALVTGPLTGGSFNPARSLGPALAGNIWTGHWLYWIAPIGGMLLAARVYAFLSDAEPQAGRTS